MRPGETSSSESKFWSKWPKSSYLGLLEPRTRDDFLSLGRPREYPESGRVLFSEGSTTDYVFALLSGVVKQTIAHESGDVLVGIQVGGDILGGMEAIDNGPHLTTEVTAGPVIASRISTSDLQKFLRTNPNAAVVLSQWIASQLRAATRRIVDFSAVNSSTRLARVLLELAEKYGEQTPNGIALRVPLAQSELAALAGTGEVTLQRSLRQLRTAGVITTGYREMTVRDLAALRELANPR